MSEETTRGHAPRGPLRRDRRSKVIAGVCGGLGRHLDIDPVVFRILFAVLSFVGGIGLLAYAAAWLFVPQEGAERSEAHRLLTGSNPLLAVVVAVGLGVGALASISALTQGTTNAWPLWLIGAAVLGVLVWRGDIRLGRGALARAPEQPPTWWQQTVAAEETQGTTTAGGEPSSAPGSVNGETGEPVDATPEEYAAGPGNGSQRTSWVDLSNLGAGSGPGYEGWGEGARTAARPRRRGYGGLVLAILLAATGVLGVLDAAGLVNLSWLSGGALVLLLLGAGMTVGGAFGKTTALVPVGLVLAIPLITLSAVGVPLHGTVGDVNWAPASVARLQPMYQLAIGDGDLDLTGITPGAGTSITVNGQVGAGDLSVQVPTDVNVVVHAHAGIGQIEQDGAANNSDGDNDSGISADQTFEIPAKGTAQGTLVLNLKVGIGDVNVEAGDS
jgi:phage shock protein PspC (stress-responsive transcriptional regulator)